VDTPVTSVEQRVRALATVTLPAAPGCRFQCSNTNYDTLGLVIAAVSGQSYAAYLQEHVFTPLGMTHSYAAEAPAQRHGLATGHACKRYTLGRCAAAPGRHRRLVLARPAPLTRAAGRRAAAAHGARSSVPDGAASLPQGA
jgi:CubicO group peptidase (beta-lactamase class C family)